MSRVPPLPDHPTGEARPCGSRLAWPVWQRGRATSQIHTGLRFAEKNRPLGSRRLCHAAGTMRKGLLGGHPLDKGKHTPTDTTGAINVQVLMLSDTTPIPDTASSLAAEMR